MKQSVDEESDDDDDSVEPIKVVSSNLSHFEMPHFYQTQVLPKYQQKLEKRLSKSSARIKNIEKELSGIKNFLGKIWKKLSGKSRSPSPTSHPPDIPPP